MRSRKVDAEATNAILVREDGHLHAITVHAVDVPALVLK